MKKLLCVAKVDTISFTQSIYSIIENSGSVQIQLIYSDSNSSRNFTIQVLSVGGSATGVLSVGGSATGEYYILTMYLLDVMFHETGQDYEPGPYTVAFPAEITSAFLNISITNDEIFEANETFDLVLNSSSLPPNVTAGDIGQATVIILNDDGK